MSGICALWLGDLKQAGERLRRAAAQAEHTENQLAQIHALDGEAMVGVLTGDLRAAEQVLARAYAVVKVPALAAARLAAARGRWGRPSSPPATPPNWPAGSARPLRRWPSR
ncbi:hypothetical protein ACFSHS_16520 [Blastococcus deserti]|uniref:ANTAR domain-containing protein n=1 Tax=Blastococcus deserti TaxID=2259033 RepID=A0ABW4XCK9_9ACTN